MLLDKLISDISRTITLYSATLGKAFMSFFSSIGALLELYNLYSVFIEKEVGQRKTKLGTYFLGLGINVFYTIAAVTGKFLNYLGLGFFGLAAEIVALFRASYILHESRVLTQLTKRALNQLVHDYNPLAHNAHEVYEEIKQLQKNLVDQRDFRFKNKVDTGYSIISVISSGIFIAGLFFPPLIIASFVLFTLFKSLQAYDTYNNYKLNRWLSSTWDALFGDPIKPIEPPIAEPDPLAVNAHVNNVSSLSTANIIRQTLAHSAGNNKPNEELKISPDKEQPNGAVEAKQADEELNASSNKKQPAEQDQLAPAKPTSDSDTENEEEDDLDVPEIPLLENRRLSM